MSEVEKQEGQKTVVAFIAGLLIGGLLVWVFSGTSEGKYEDKGTWNEESGEWEDKEISDEEMNNDAESMEDMDMSEEEASPVLETGEGAIEVNDQAAGSVVTIAGATFPNDEGWIAVRSYESDQLGNILGAARFSKEQGLVPTEVPLLAPTRTGNQYAVVFYTEDGNREFNLSGDVQVEGVWEGFTAK